MHYRSNMVSQSGRERERRRLRRVYYNVFLIHTHTLSYSCARGPFCFCNAPMTHRGPIESPPVVRFFFLISIYSSRGPLFGSHPPLYHPPLLLYTTVHTHTHSTHVCARLSLYSSGNSLASLSLSLVLIIQFEFTFYIAHPIFLQCNRAYPRA